MIKFNRFSLITGGSSAVGKDYVRLLQCIKFEIKNCITPQILVSDSKLLKFIY